MKPYTVPTIFFPFIFPTSIMQADETGSLDFTGFTQFLGHSSSQIHYLNKVFYADLDLFNSSFMNGLNVSTILLIVFIVAKCNRSLSFHNSVVTIFFGNLLEMRNYLHSKHYLYYDAIPVRIYIIPLKYAIVFHYHDSQSFLTNLLALSIFLL